MASLSIKCFELKRQKLHQINTINKVYVLQELLSYKGLYVIKAALFLRNF